MKANTPAPRLWLSRVGWMVLIWSASVIGLGAVAALFRVVMKLAGMSH